MLQLALVDRKFPEVRSGAAYLLGTAKSDQAEVVQSLRNALQDPDPRVPYQARFVRIVTSIDIKKYYHSSKWSPLASILFSRHSIPLRECKSIKFSCT